MIRTIKQVFVSDSFSAAILPLLMIVVSYHAFGFFFETNDDPQMALLFNGFWSTGPEPDLQFWHLFTGYLLSMLYQEFDSIAWYGLFMYMMLWFSTINFFLIIRTLFKVKPLWLSILSFVFIFYFVVFENIVLLNFSRVAILLSGSALLLFLVREICTQDQKNGAVLFSWCIIQYILSALTRPEGAFLSAVIMIPLYITFYFFTKKSLGKMIYFYAAIAFVTIGIEVYQQHTIGHDTMDRKKYLNAITDYRSLSDTGIYNPKDSAIRMAILNWIFWDKTIMTNDYLNQKIDGGSRFSNITEKYVSSVRHTFWIFLKNQSVAAIINGVIFLTVCWIFITSRVRYQSILYVLSHLLFWTIVITIMVLFKLPNRVLNPLIVLYTFGHLILFAEIQKLYALYIRTIIIYAIGSIVFLGCMGYTYRMTGQVRLFQTREKQNRNKLLEISQLTDTDLVIFTAPAGLLFTGVDPLKSIDFDRDKTYLLIGGWATWHASFEKKLISICGSDQFDKFFDCIASKKHVIISSSQHNSIISDYLEKVYYKRIRLDAPYENCFYTEPTYTTQLNCYKIRVINGN